MTLPPSLASFTPPSGGEATPHCCLSLSLNSPLIFSPPIPFPSSSPTHRSPLPSRSSGEGGSVRPDATPHHTVRRPGSPAPARPGCGSDHPSSDRLATAAACSRRAKGNHPPGFGGRVVWSREE